MRDSVVRNIKLLWAFFSNSLTRDMEFKANFISMIFVDAVFYGAHFLFFSIIFSFVDSLMEFTKGDVTVFLVVTFMMDTVFMLFLAENVGKLNRMIVKGDLDFVLLKPVNSQFFSSFRYFNTYASFSIFILMFLLWSAVTASGREVGIMNIAAFTISFIFGIMIYYAVDIMIASLAFWFKNFSMAGWLSHEVMKFSMRPDTIYSGLLRKTMFSLLPMALISSVPTRMLIYGPDIKYLGVQFVVVIVFLIIARIVWVRGLLRYESASS